MAGVTTYARLAASPCPPVADLLLALANALGGTDAPGTLERLDDAARPLFGIGSMTPDEAARRLVSVLVDEHGFRVGGHGHADAFLLDRVIQRRCGHPVLVAAVAHELARRAGVRSEVLSSRRGWYVGLGHPERMTLVTFDRLAEPATPGELRRRCAHEVAYATLSGIERARRREDDHVGAQRAAGLRRLLPMEGHQAPHRLED